MNKNEFLNPGQDYRGVTLWMLNDLLEEPEIERQIENFGKAGWGAVITRTFNGLRTEYLSDKWHAVVTRIIETARRHSMKVWLQAGYMPSAVPNLPDDEQHRVLIAKQAPASLGPEESLLLERDGKLYLACRKAHVIDLLDPESCRKYVQDAYEKPMARTYGEEMGKVVETVWVDEPHFNPPELPWSNRLPSRFNELWGYDIVDNLPSLFGESGDFRKIRHHFWRTVLQMLMESYFENVAKWCEEHGVQFSGHLMGEDTLQAQISWTAACMPLYEYMGLPGIDYLTGSLKWPAERPFIMTPKQCSSASSQLGKGRALAEIYGVSSQGLSFKDRKRIAQWIMMLGINYRCYHGSFYSLRGRRKRIYAPTLSVQQPWWSENRMMADYFARFSYLMRQGRYAAEILVLHPVESAFCVYDSSEVDNPYERVQEPPAVRRYTDSFITLSENLLGLHYGFEYGDETLAAKHGAVQGSQISIGRASYSCVVLPPLITIRRSTYDLLSAFKARGGIILAVEQLPQRIDGVPDEAEGRLKALFEGVPVLENTIDALGLELARKLKRTVSLSTSGSAPAGAGLTDVWLHERITGEGRLIALTNIREDAPIDVKLCVHAEGTLEAWNLESGDTSVPAQRHEPGVTSLDLRLWPVGLAVYLFREGKTAEKETPRLRSVRSIHLDSVYHVEPPARNVMPLDFCRYKAGGDWSDPMPVIAVQEVLADQEYRGDVALRFSFDVEEKPAEISVVIEDADECTVLANGRKVEYAGDGYFIDPCFKPVDISAATQAGENIIEITRYFEPPAQPRFRLGGLFQTATGVELEPVYLIGRFGVYGSESPRPEKRKALRFAPNFRIGGTSDQSGRNLAAGGYPFFAGKLRIGQHVQIEKPAPEERVFLRFESVDTAVATIHVNGVQCGLLAWPPYEADITDQVKAGENYIEIQLCTSLRNMLGPHHRPSGEPDQVWGDGWTGLSTQRRRDTSLISGPDWWKNRDSSSVFWTDDYFLIPFGLSGGMIEFRAAR